MSFIAATAILSNNSTYFCKSVWIISPWSPTVARFIVTYVSRVGGMLMSTFLFSAGSVQKSSYNSSASIPYMVSQYSPQQLHICRFSIVLHCFLWLRIESTELEWSPTDQEWDSTCHVSLKVMVTYPFQILLHKLQLGHLTRRCGDNSHQPMAAWDKYMLFGTLCVRQCKAVYVSNDIYPLYDLASTERAVTASSSSEPARHLIMMSEKEWRE